MPRIVFLGSLLLGEYNITVPIKEPDYDTNHEKAYLRSTKEFHKKIDEANIVICLFSDTEIGKHTKRDIQYTKSKKKPLIFINVGENDIEEQSNRNGNKND